MDNLIKIVLDIGGKEFLNEIKQSMEPDEATFGLIDKVLTGTIIGKVFSAIPADPMFHNKTAVSKNVKSANLYKLLVERSTSILKSHPVEVKSEESSADNSKEASKDSLSQANSNGPPALR